MKPAILVMCGYSVFCGLLIGSSLPNTRQVTSVSVPERQVIAVSKPAANDDAVNPEPEMPPANVTTTVTTAPEQDAEPEAVSFTQPCQSETCRCKPCYCLDGCKCGVAHKFVGSVDAGNQCLACWEVKSHPLHANASASPVATYTAPAPAGRYVLASRPIFGRFGRTVGYQQVWVWQWYQAPRQYQYQTRYYYSGNCANGRCN
jgi:hypothetical protein